MPPPVVPVVPSWGFEVERSKGVLIYEPDDGPRQTVTKGPQKQKFPFTTTPRPKAEFTALLAFWDANYPATPVSFTHPGTGVTSLYLIDSPLKEQWHRLNLVSYSFVLKEV